MSAATRFVWESLGRPSLVPSAEALIAEPGVCRMCGIEGEPTAPAKKALGTNWTDHSCFTRPEAERVCRACLWTCSGKPPQTVRMWSVVATPGHAQPTSSEKAPWDSTDVCLTNRGNTRPIIDTLTAPPSTAWLISIAVSGQKHILPYARVNTSREEWTVRLEDTNVTATPQTWQHVHENALALRRLGIRDDDILTGTPGPIKDADTLTRWRKHALELTPHTNAPLLRLALWTITKPIIEGVPA